MLLSVVFNLGMLGYFKYGGFLLESFQSLAATFGIDQVMDQLTTGAAGSN